MNSEQIIWIGVSIFITVLLVGAVMAILRAPSTLMPIYRKIVQRHRIREGEELLYLECGHNITVQYMRRESFPCEVCQNEGRTH